MGNSKEGRLLRYVGQLTTVILALKFARISFMLIFWGFLLNSKPDRSQRPNQGHYV